MSARSASSSSAARFAASPFLPRSVRIARRVARRKPPAVRSRVALPSDASIPKIAPPTVGSFGKMLLMASLTVVEPGSTVPCVRPFV